VADAVESLYALDPSQRRLLTVAQTLPRGLAQHLHRWVHGGPYGAVFDAVEDTLTLGTFQCFEFQGLEDYPLILEPLLLYVLHRANAAIRDQDARSRLKLFLLDEAWRFAKDPVVKTYMVEALKKTDGATDGRSTHDDRHVLQHAVAREDTQETADRRAVAREDPKCHPVCRLLGHGRVEPEHEILAPRRNRPTAHVRPRRPRRASVHSVSTRHNWQPQPKKPRSGLFS
jgi:hypothetical protein